jgi:hypothetical protein
MAGTEVTTLSDRRQLEAHAAALTARLARRRALPLVLRRGPDAHAYRVETREMSLPELVALLEREVGHDCCGAACLVCRARAGEFAIAAGGAR